MTRKPRLTILEIEAALRRHAGVVALAARELGVCRQTIHQRIGRSPALQQIVRDIVETALDMGEAVVMEAVGQKDGAMTRWFLERRGKDRGWTTRQEITGKDGGPIDIDSIIEGLTDEEAAFFQRLRSARSKDPPGRS